MVKQQLYKKYAKYYDIFYSQKNYDSEVEFIESIAKNFKVKGKEILDMACGTGNHAQRLAKDGFIVTCVDINSDMLKIAKKKVKNAKFVNGSMQSFKSKRKYDIITCLFSAMSYNKNKSELNQTLLNFYNLLNKGGVVIFDITLFKNIEERYPAYLATFSEDNLQIGMVSQWRQSKENPDIFNVNFLILVKEKGKVDFEIDEHELRRFTIEDVRSAMKTIGFDVKIYDYFSLKRHTKRSIKSVFVGIK